jgi:hypothetical protein
MKSMQKKTILRCSVLVALFAIAAGCGKRPATYEGNRGLVTGTVSVDGKLVGGGSVTFVSAKDPMYRVTVMIKPDGSFRVGDAPLGEVLVAVETESAKIGNPSGYIPIPRKYTNVKTSGLTATIKKRTGEEEMPKLTFDLKGK